MRSSAVISPCGLYRYRLERWWTAGSRNVLWVMLNPSTADAHQDDPTIAKCIRFSKAWGFDGITVGNVYAWRATDPRALRQVSDPVGPENDAHLRRMARHASLIVAAWGTKADVRRAERTLDLLRRVGTVHALRIAKGGQPWHPLYLPETLRPEPWRGPLIGEEIIHG